MTRRGAFISPLELNRDLRHGLLRVRRLGWPRKPRLGVMRSAAPSGDNFTGVLASVSAASGPSSAARCRHVAERAQQSATGKRCRNNLAHRWRPSLAAEQQRSLARPTGMSIWSSLDECELPWLPRRGRHPTQPGAELEGRPSHRSVVRLVRFGHAESVRRCRERLVSALVDADTIEAVVHAADSVLRVGVGADGGAWCTVDPASLLGTSCLILVDLGDGPVEVAEDPRRASRVCSLECDDTQPNTFAAMYHVGRTAAGLTLDVGAGRLGGVRRVQEVMRPLGATDELRVLLCDRSTLWGTIVFYRFFGQVPFGEPDVAVAVGGAPLIAKALRRAMLHAALDHPHLDTPPGAITVAPDDTVIATSAAAEALLDHLGERHARTALLSVTAATRARGAASTSVFGPAGLVALHGAPVKGEPSTVTVVIEQPRPTALASLIVERLELTPRETDVTIQVLRGASRAHTARTLAISEQTVADVVSAVFRKAAVHSRAELCHLIDETHFEPLRRRAAAPSPYGYFLDEPPRAPDPPRGGDGRRPRLLRTVDAASTPRTEVPMPPTARTCSPTPTRRCAAACSTSPSTPAPSTGPTPTASATFTDRWGVMRRLLESHARHEDDYIYQLLVDADPELIAGLTREHADIETQIDALGDSIERARTGHDPDTAAGPARDLQRFTATYLGHLDDEESQALPAVGLTAPTSSFAVSSRLPPARGPRGPRRTPIAPAALDPAAARRMVIAAGRGSLPSRPRFLKIGNVLRSRLSDDIWDSVADLFSAEGAPA